ncbi:MAG: N-acetylmuramoyl-L-alanine amidase [Odoribacter sp.]
MKNHLFSGTFAGRSVKQLHCHKQSSRLEYPELIILHYTAGGNAMSSAQYLARSDTDRSAHLVIARDGGIIQVLPFDTIAWHTGQSEYNGRTNLDHFSLGIELDNAGELHRRKGRFYSWFNKEYMPDEVYTDCENGRARYWHRYTKEQIDTTLLVCDLLIKTYPIREVLRHSEVNKHKLDPGPAFPLESLLPSLKTEHRQSVG